MLRPPADGEQFGRRRDQVIADLEADEQNKACQQNAQLLPFDLHAQPRADLRADHAADQQEQRQRRINRLVLRRVQDGGEASDEDNLEQRRADDDRSRRGFDAI